MGTNDVRLQGKLRQFIQGFQLTQAIYVVTKLRIADLLKDGPKVTRSLRRKRARTPRRSIAPISQFFCKGY